MNILVIGGNGFIGSHLIDRLLVDNHKVRVFDFYPEKYRKPLTNVDYRLYKLDNLTELYEAMLGIDIIFHLASASVPSTSNEDHIGDINNNLIPTLNILNLMHKQGIKKIVYFSSGGAAYGNTEYNPIPECTPLNPISSYGMVKVTIEQYIQLYHRLYGIHYLIVRPSNPYGPRQGHFIAQGVISTFLKKVIMGEGLNVYGDGSATKDYIYIEDFISILYHLVEMDACGIYNLGSGQGTNITSIIENIKEVTGIDCHVNYTLPKSYDVKNFVLDLCKTKEVIGDFQYIPIKEGITKTWEWLKSSHSVLESLKVTLN